MKLFFAADHAGFKLKERLKKYAIALGYETIDAGAFELDHDDDYPDFVVPAVRAAVATRGKAVVVGGSGLGECIGGQAGACTLEKQRIRPRLGNYLRRPPRRSGQPAPESAAGRFERSDCPPLTGVGPSSPVLTFSPRSD